MKRRRKIKNDNHVKSQTEIDGGERTKEELDNSENQTDKQMSAMTLNDDYKPSTYIHKNNTNMNR